MLCRGIEAGYHYSTVCDEHSANFASITELVFLRLILQHIGESPEEFARASLSQIPVHRPKIRMLPEQIISLKIHGAGEGGDGNATEKYTKN